MRGIYSKKKAGARPAQNFFQPQRNSSPYILEEVGTPMGGVFPRLFGVDLVRKKTPTRGVKRRKPRGDNCVAR